MLNIFHCYDNYLESAKIRKIVVKHHQQRGWTIQVAFDSEGMSEKG